MITPFDKIRMSLDDPEALKENEVELKKIAELEAGGNNNLKIPRAPSSRILTPPPKDWLNEWEDKKDDRSEKLTGKFGPDV